MALILKYFLIAVVGILTSCGSDDEFAGSPPPPSSWSRAPAIAPIQQGKDCVRPTSPAGSSPCQEKQISIENCFFCLPPFAVGSRKLYIGRYRDEKDIHGVGGVTFGFGQWRCENGVWRPLREPICNTCRPGLNLRDCFNRWNDRNKIPPRYFFESL